MDQLMTQVVKLYFARSFALNEKLKIHPGQVALLRTLSEHEGLSQRELAEILLVKASTITVMLNRMEATGYIVKKQDEKDQRKTKIYLSEDGKGIIESVEKNTKQLEDETMKGFSMEERILLKRMFQHMKANLQEVVKEITMPHPCEDECHSKKGKESK